MKGSKFDSKFSSGGLAFQPLYKQVEEHVTQTDCGTAVETR